MAVKENKTNPKSTLSERDKAAQTVASGPARSRFDSAGRHIDEPGPLSMTGIRTGLLHSMFIKVLMGLLIFIFAIGVALTGLGGPGNNADAPRQLGGGPDPVAQVGDEEISREKFQLALAQQNQMNEQFGMSSPAEQALGTRQSTLQNLIDEAARYNEAQRLGITATDAEVEAKINQQIEDALKPQPGQSEASVRRQIEAQGKTLDQWRQETRARFDEAEVREELRRSIILEKLEKKIKDENKASEEDYKRSMTRLKLRQIKIAPKPISPTDKDPKAAQAKAEAEAKARAEKLAASLKNATAAQFAAVAKKESSDIATKAKGGDLGAKMPNELPLSPALKDAVVNASGNVVGPVQDEYSKEYSIFFIENRKLELPKDYAKNKTKLLADFDTQKDNEVWQKWQEELKKKTTPEIEDPALIAHKIQTEEVYSKQGDEQKALRQQAIDKYTEALQYAAPAEATAIHYQLAQLYRDAGQADKQLEELKKASESGSAKQAKIEYARALREQKKNDEALKQLNELSKTLTESPTQPSPFMGGGNPDDGLRYQIASEFEALGKKDLATAERGKIKPPQAQPGMGGLNLGGGANQTITIPSTR
ncbi:MAG: SurA N-terminal domain [Abditibacteriota bacterium]|nr:SurA N-terminal domain [Abditibacteriota bacterium]